MTPAQRRAIETHWHAYGLEAGEAMDFSVVFGRAAPLTLEIGFGNGENLLSMAIAEPQSDFLGIEVHRPGIGHLLNAATEASLTNLKVIRADVTAVLPDNVADASFTRVLVLFPDPWPKRKHHKRRLLTSTFIAVLAAKIVDGGLLHLATDWQDYAEEMQKLIAANGCFGSVGNGIRPRWRFGTRFEARTQEAGRKVTNLLYRKIKADRGGRISTG